MRCPDSLIISISSVMFRFFYTVKEDYRQIKEAMYLQGLVTSQFFCQPLRMIEYRFVPLLMCFSRTADDAATSATTRGMSVGQERSSISKSRLRLLDYFWMFAMFAILILMIWS
nr:energy-coupling factor transporter transmembrane component T [Streptococcus lutetiensis]